MIISDLYAIIYTVFFCKNYLSNSLPIITTGYNTLPQIDYLLFLLHYQE